MCLRLYGVPAYTALACHGQFDLDLGVAACPSGIAHIAERMRALVT